MSPRAARPVPLRWSCPRTSSTRRPRPGSTLRDRGSSRVRAPRLSIDSPGCSRRPVSQSYSFPTAPQPQLPFVHIWRDPNEVGRVWRSDLGMPCSPYEVIKGLLRRDAPVDAGKRRGWVDRLHAIHRKLLAKEWEPTSDGVNFAAIVCEVDKHLAPDATVTTDAGNFGSFVHRYIGFRQRQIFLSSVDRKSTRLNSS